MLIIILENLLIFCFAIEMKYYMGIHLSCVKILSIPEMCPIFCPVHKLIAVLCMWNYMFWQNHPYLPVNWHLACIDSYAVKTRRHSFCNIIAMYTSYPLCCVKMHIHGLALMIKPVDNKCLKLIVTMYIAWLTVLLEYFAVCEYVLWRHMHQYCMQNCLIFTPKQQTYQMCRN